MPTPEWFQEMLGWKPATQNTTSRCLRAFGIPYGPNLADLSGPGSTAISGRVYDILGVPKTASTDLDLNADDNSSSGTALERALERDIEDSLQSIAPGRGWDVTHSGGVGQFAQYTHLAELQKLFEREPTLRSTIGRDYQVSTDVMVSLPNPAGAERARVFHAAVSSKLTIRSDRVQNIRYEFGTLVRNRRGRLPHLVVVTAEPLPSRLVSIGRGLGEIDAIYHLLFDELQQTVLEGTLPHFRQRDWDEQRHDWRELVDQERVKPYSELVPSIAAG